MTEVDLYKKVLLIEGENKQIDICIEEMSELIQALLKRKRGLKSNICEEIADVEITLAQMKLTFNEGTLVEDWKAFKLHRLAELFGYKEEA
ncbi:MAG: hypothetical protein M0R51_17925 [Clostridia bacterium]|nr:hypothetical protein [Clostridia bacterium]